MKIVTVLGARPQFIKASVVSHALRGSGAIDEVMVHTGQHFDANMSDVFFAELGIALPTHVLGIHGGGQGEMTGRMLAEVERVLIDEKSSGVLVYGDTNATLADAPAAVKLYIPVAHVEAALRSFNLAVPEDVKRILNDHISQGPFTPAVAAAALEEVSRHLPVAWPLRTRTWGVLMASGRLGRILERLRLIEPFGTLDRVALEMHAVVIATDSGDVHKEAFFLRLPCVTPRDETEWVELVDAGWNRLAPPPPAESVSAAVRAAIGTRGVDIAPCGRGHGEAARCIVQRLRADLGA